MSQSQTKKRWSVEHIREFNQESSSTKFHAKFGQNSLKHHNQI